MKRARAAFSAILLENEIGGSYPEDMMNLMRKAVTIIEHLGTNRKDLHNKRALELIEAKISNGDQDIVLATNGGKAIRFAENTIRSTGRKTMGVRGISMSFDDDFVVGMLVVKRDGSILAATDKGYGKRSDVEAYRTQNRGGKGVYTVKSTPKVGKLVSIMEVVDEDDIMIITTKGIMIRQPVEKIKVIGKNTQGVKLLRLDDGAFISSITKVVKEEAEEGSEEGSEEGLNEEGDSEENPKTEG